MASHGIVVNSSTLREPSHATSRRTSTTDVSLPPSSTAISSAEAVSLLQDRHLAAEGAGSPSRILQPNADVPQAPPSRETLIKQLRGIEALLEIKTKEVNKLIDTLKISPQYDLEEYLEEYNSTCHQVHLLQLQRDRVKLQATLLQQQQDQQQLHHYRTSAMSSAPVVTSVASTTALPSHVDYPSHSSPAQSIQPNQMLKTAVEERTAGNRAVERADNGESVSAVSATGARDYNSQISTASVASVPTTSSDSPRTTSPRTHRRVTPTSNTAQMSLMSSTAMVPPTSPALPSTHAAAALARQQQVAYSSSPPVEKADQISDLVDSGFAGSGSLKQPLSTISTLSPSSIGLMHSTSTQSTSSTTSTITTPSLVPDGFIQVYLPDGQHSRVKIVPGKTLRDVLSAKLNQRCLMPELCHAYKGQPEQSVEGGSTFYTRQPVEWTTDSAQLGCSTITVERDNAKEPTNIKEFSFKWRRISHDLDRSSSILDRKPCFVCRSTVFRGFKCRQCKIKVHYECADRMPNICTSEPNPQAIRRIINLGFLAVPISPGHNQNQFFADDNNPTVGGADNNTAATAAAARAGRGGSAVAGSSSPNVGAADIADAANDSPSGTLRAGRSTSEPDVSRHGVTTNNTLDDGTVAAAAAAAAVNSGKTILSSADSNRGLVPPPVSGLLAVTPPAAADSSSSSTATNNSHSTIAERRKAGAQLAAIHTNMPLPTVVLPSHAADCDTTTTTATSTTNDSVQVRLQPQHKTNSLSRFAEFFREDDDDDDEDADVELYIQPPECCGNEEDNNGDLIINLPRKVVSGWLECTPRQQLSLVQQADGRTAITIPPRTPATATSLTPSTAGGTTSTSSTATTPLSGSFLSQHQLNNTAAADAVSTTPNATTTTNKAVRIRVQQQLNQQQYLQQKFRQDTDRESMQDWEIPDAEICDRKQVGSGSFGTVYKAKWHGEVALKKLKVANPSKEQLDSFKNEVRVLKRLRHTNIVLFMGCVLQPNLAIVTEWCPGDSLYKKLHVDDHSLDNNQIFSVAEQTILGMEYLHAKSIIHRDLKSNNIFLKENWTVKIGDMGLSIVKTAWTGPGTSRNPSYPFGSVLWMAPEIINPKLIGKDAEPYTEKSDVYAFGIVLYELWSGLLPYTGEPKDSIMWGVGRGTMKPDLTKLKNSCPKGMRKLLTDCIQTDRDKRPTFYELIKSYADVMELVPRISRSMSDDRLHRASLKLSDYEQNTVQSGRKQQVAPLPAQWQNHYRQYSSNMSNGGNTTLLNSKSDDDTNGTLTSAESAALLVGGGDKNSRSATPLASSVDPTDTVDGGQPETVMPSSSGDAAESRFTRAKRLISGVPSNSSSFRQTERGDSPGSGGGGGGLLLQPLDGSTTASLLALCMQQPPAPKSASPACMPVPSSSSSSSGSSASGTSASNRSKFFGATPLSQFPSSSASSRQGYSSSSGTSTSSYSNTTTNHQALPDVFVFPPPAPSALAGVAASSARDVADENSTTRRDDSRTSTTTGNGVSGIAATTTTRYMPARNRYVHSTRALSEERVLAGTTSNAAINMPQPRGPYVRRIREEFEPSSTPTSILTGTSQPLTTRTNTSDGVAQPAGKAGNLRGSSSTNPAALDNI